jgi:hypothetical protein
MFAGTLAKSSDMLPPKFRRIENLHILFWLVKDICWVSDFRIPGLIMILPTMGVALWMTWKLRLNPSEFAHNLAVAFWIAANSVWMIGEFYFADGIRHLARAFFVLGIATLAIYYAGFAAGFFRIKEPRGTPESDQSSL